MYNADPTNPKLSFPSPDVALFSLPNFFSQNYSLLKNLLKTNEEKLKRCPYWIIDLRNNEGGNVAMGNLLLPYLYTNPIIDYNTKSRITESNYEKWFNSYVKEAYDAASATEKNEFDSTKAIVLQHTGEFWPILNNPNKADTIMMDNIKEKPIKVALLINENTISSGELFCMLLKQSKKVTIYGQPSAGVIDYGNIVSYTTGCNNIKITLPTDRFNWLDDGISVDRDKIQPQVLIKNSEKDWIKFVITQLRKK